MKKQKIINKKRLLVLLQRQNRAGCSDKKLLWRANLYVDERAEEGGDWNDLHPWTYANGNAWATGTNTNGTQQSILPWTIFTDGSKDDAITPVIRGVAYGWGCDDNFAEFNSELLLQQDAIQRYHQAAVDAYCSENGITQDAIDVDELPEGSTIPLSLDFLDHNTTSAPSGNWDYYTFPSRRESTTTEKNSAGVNITFNYWDYDAELSDVILNQLGNPKQHDFYLHEDFSVPGLSTFLGFCKDDVRNEEIDNSDDDNPRNYQTNQAGLTSGVDCSGFVERAADYMGSGYIITEGNETAAKVNTTMFGYDSNSWLIVSDALTGSNLELLNNLVPGDILVDPGSHVMIVQDIQYPNGNREITDLSQITIIQASRGQVLVETDESGNNTTFTTTDYIWKTNISNGTYSGDYQFKRLRRD